MATVLAAYEMKAFATPRQREEVKAAVARAKEWLAKAPLLRQEDRNARL
jgi:hypothetical protein